MSPKPDFGHNNISVLPVLKDVRVLGIKKRTPSDKTSSLKENRSLFLPWATILEQQKKTDTVLSNGIHTLGKQIARYSAAIKRTYKKAYNYTDFSAKIKKLKNTME
jgi:hypothetical protein